MFGELVQAHRQRLRLTQEELAHRTGLSVRTIRELESGRVRAPRHSSVRMLADAFGLHGPDRDDFEDRAAGASDHDVAGLELPPRAERTLPADIAGFVGRDHELQHLIAAIDGAAAGSVQAVAIHAVDGMAGVGKTAFAVRAAHHLACRFPDGQRFVNLRAHAPGETAVAPAAALETLLQADGVAAQQVPVGLDARAGLWRERMADKKMLLVLDDAADTDHVAALLPAAPGCLVLITSRRKLATLPGAALLSLDTLPPADAARLFAHRIGARAHHDEDAVERVTRLCGYLPLAITLTAARLHVHPSWTVAELADDLAHARDRLAELVSGDLAVAAAFDLSYRDLPADRQRLFRRLALHPGPDFDAYAAAALDHTTLADARRGLEDLLEHNLLSEPRRDRYHFHDLIAEYARTHATAEAERDAAVDRILGYYLHTATIASRRHTGAAPPIDAATAGDPPAEVPPIDDPQQATDWFTAEQTNLAAATTRAATRDHPAAIGIPAAINDHLRSRGPLDLGIRLHCTALDTARRTGDQRAQAYTLNNLAQMQRLTNNFSAGAAAAQHASALYERLGDVAGQASALNTLALVRSLGNDFPGAAAAAEQAHRLYRKVDDRTGQATALNTLARAQQVSGDFVAAGHAAEQACALFEETGGLQGQATALNILARVRSMAGNVPAALVAAERAYALHQQIDNRYGQANVLCTLAHLYHTTGDLPAAVRAAEQAHRLHHEIGARHGDATALHFLAIAQHATGDLPAAAASAERSRHIFEQIGDQLGLANAAQIHGVVHHAAGDLPAATATLDRALTLFRAVGDRDGEAECLNHIGRLQLDTTTPDIAYQQFSTALDIARSIGTPTHEAVAVEGVAHCLLRCGRHDEGIRHLRDALTMYRRINSPNADRVERDLEQALALLPDRQHGEDAE